MTLFPYKKGYPNFRKAHSGANQFDPDQLFDIIQGDASLYPQYDAKSGQDDRHQGGVNRPRGSAIECSGLHRQMQFGRYAVCVNVEMLWPPTVAAFDIRDATLLQ